MIGIHRRRRPSRKLLLRLAAAAAAAAVLWLAGLVWFATLIPDEVEDATTRTDAIVVLTGGVGRLTTGLELLAEKRAEKLFVSGVYRGVDVKKLLEVSQRTPDELNCCVEIGHSADNTLGNAVETAAWMRRQGYRSLRIVTATYHVPRSLLEFRAALPEVDLIAHPVFPENFRQERWWAWPGTLNLVVSEFNKFVLVWLRNSAADLLGVEPSP